MRYWGWRTLTTSQGAQTVAFVREPIAYALAINDARVPVAMRLYAKGDHAFGMRPTADPIMRQWPEQAKQRLENIGILKPQDDEDCCRRARGG